MRQLFSCFSYFLTHICNKVNKMFNVFLYSRLLPSMEVDTL